MISSEVQRTLVKSPPELWAELSDPASLARHLGELGEIRITRTNPEQKIEWEAEHTTGTVVIDPSGWGTKVTLTVTREAPRTQASAEAPAAKQDGGEIGARDEADTALQDEAETAIQDEAAAAMKDEAATRIQTENDSIAGVEHDRNVESDAEPIAQAEVAPVSEAESELQQVFEPQDEIEPQDEFEPEQERELEPRRGFFARLFRRRPVAEASESSESFTSLDWWPEQREELAASEQSPQSPEPPEPRADAFAAVKRVLAPETFAAANPFAPAHTAVGPAREVVEVDQPARTHAEETDGARAEQTAPGDEQAKDISAETTAAEALVAEEVTAVLTAVLDRLGAAHHRPFSRA